MLIQERLNFAVNGVDALDDILARMATDPDCHVSSTSDHIKVENDTVLRVALTNCKFTSCCKF